MCSPEGRKQESGGADQDRTDDLLSAIQALSQTELQPHPPGEARRLAGSRKAVKPRMAAHAQRAGRLGEVEDGGEGEEFLHRAVTSPFASRCSSSSDPRRRSLRLVPCSTALSSRFAFAKTRCNVWAAASWPEGTARNADSPIARATA